MYDLEGKAVSLTAKLSLKYFVVSIHFPKPAGGAPEFLKDLLPSLPHVAAIHVHAHDTMHTAGQPRVTVYVFSLSIPLISIICQLKNGVKTCSGNPEFMFIIIASRRRDWEISVRMYPRCEMDVFVDIFPLYPPPLLSDTNHCG